MKKLLIILLAGLMFASCNSESSNKGNETKKQEKQEVKDETSKTDDTKSEEETSQEILQLKDKTETLRHTTDSLLKTLD